VGNYFYQSFNEYWFSEIEQREINTPVSLVLEPSAFEFELVILKLKIHKSPGNFKYHQISLKQVVSKFALRLIN